MNEVKKYPAGTFSWSELMTTDQEGAKAFYTGLFGWEINDVPMGPDAFYTMLMLNGLEAAALAPLSPEQLEQGMPPSWSSYVTVDDVDASAAKAAELGGTVLMPGFEVMDAGRMAVIQDPTGAVFSLWQAADHIGARVVNQASALCWNELMTRDTDAATPFYTGLFGWEAVHMDMPGGQKYTTYKNSGRMAAGQMVMDANWPAEIPAHWMLYFAVADCAASAAKAEALGGKLTVPPTTIPSVGTFSVIQDPQGAVFSIMTFEAPMDGPPG